MIYLFKTLVIIWRIFIYAVGYLVYDPLKIFAKLVIYLKHNMIFAKFFEILLDNNVTSSLMHIWLQSKNHLKVIKVYIFRFF